MLPISNPHDFRQVSAIIDVDIVPETCRRVRLLKHGSDKPLGFYIRDGTSVKVTQNGKSSIIKISNIMVDNYCIFLNEKYLYKFENSKT